MIAEGVSMVETAETAKKPEMSKRAKREKIKRELLNLPEEIPEILAIAISVPDENRQVITEPISLEYEISLYRIGRKLRYKFGIPLIDFEINNTAYLSGGSSWKSMVMQGYKIIYER